MKTWITWKREGESPARVELPAEVAETIERYASEIGAGAADVVASLVRSMAGELGQRPPFDGEAAAATLRELLDQGPVMITLRPQAPGVDIPGALSSDPIVTLRIGYGLVPPIPDLEIDADGVRGTLIFSGGQPHYCVIPWRAVLVAALEHAAPPATPAPPPAPAPTATRPKLRLV